jgi:hypothetical protein
LKKPNAPSAEAFVMPEMPKTPQEEALMVTGFLKSSLQIVRRAFLQVGRLLNEVREKKLYAAMGHPDLDSYAFERLSLGKSSLHIYLHIFDWVREHHPEWIDAAPGVVVPDLNDVKDLIFVDNELKRTDLEPAPRKKLEAIKEKALKGELKKSETAAYRRGSRTGDEGLKAFLSSLRQLRIRGSRLKGVPPEAVARLDEAIEIVAHANTLAGLPAPAKGLKSPVSTQK